MAKEVSDYLGAGDVKAQQPSVKEASEKVASALTHGNVQYLFQDALLKAALRSPAKVYIDTMVHLSHATEDMKKCISQGMTFDNSLWHDVKASDWAGSMPTPLWAWFRFVSNINISNVSVRPCDQVCESLIRDTFAVLMQTGCSTYAQLNLRRRQGRSLRLIEETAKLRDPLPFRLLVQALDPASHGWITKESRIRSLTAHFTALRCTKPHSDDTPACGLISQRYSILALATSPGCDAIWSYLTGMDEKVFVQTNATAAAATAVNHDLSQQLLEDLHSAARDGVCPFAPGLPQDRSGDPFWCAVRLSVSNRQALWLARHLSPCALRLSLRQLGDLDDHRAITSEVKSALLERVPDFSLHDVCEGSHLTIVQTWAACETDWPLRDAILEKARVFGLEYYRDAARLVVMGLLGDKPSAPSLMLRELCPLILQYAALPVEAVGIHNGVSVPATSVPATSVSATSLPAA